MSVSGFTSQEICILKVAYQTFITKEYSLKTFQNKWPNTGFEGWVVGELLIQFEVRGLNPQKKRKPDLVINDLEIEIKGCAHPKNTRSAGWLIPDYLNHPSPNLLHLWVFAKAKILPHLEAFFDLYKINRKALCLGESGWMVMISKQAYATPKQLKNLSYRNWCAQRKVM